MKHIEPPLVERAHALAVRVHHGHFRRDLKTPYIVHPRAVADWLRRSGYSDDLQAAGWLHDSLEDTDLTRDELVTATNPRVLSIVEALTKRPGEHYEDYIKNLAKLNFRKDPIGILAVPVKIADIISNLNDTPTATECVMTTTAPSSGPEREASEAFQMGLALIQFAQALCKASGAKTEIEVRADGKTIDRQTSHDPSSN